MTMTETIQEKSDNALLRLYAKTRSEAAFAELSRRYLRLIYATCLRETGDSGLAEDAAQSVLLLLSQKAGALNPSGSLAGWLFAAARYLSRNLVKQERRRLITETRAAREAEHAQDFGQPKNDLWDQIEPHWHPALARLRSADRDALLLRVVQQESLAEVGARLGISENTARMRITRALGKVRAHLQAAGIAVTVVVLAALLEEQPATAIPPDLMEAAARIAGGGLAPAARVTPWLRRAEWQFAGVRPLKGIALAGILLILGVTCAVRLSQPQPLSAAERQRLFTALAGTWRGTLEYADDQTHKHYTYPTQVALTSLNGGSVLRMVATYTGSASVDVTTFSRQPGAERFVVQNGGPKSSHGLYGVGDLVRLPGGGFAFQGLSEGRDAEVRLRLQPAGNRLTLIEEYRKRNEGFGPGYLFRNRFTLRKQ